MSLLTKWLGLDRVLGKRDVMSTLTIWLRDRALHLPHDEAVVLARKLGLPLVVVEMFNDQIASMAVQAIVDLRPTEWLAARALRVPDEMIRHCAAKLKVSPSLLMVLNNELESRILKAIGAA